MVGQERDGDHRVLTGEQLEKRVGNLLRFGVLLSAAVVVVGAVMYLIVHGSQQTNYTQFRGEPEQLSNVRSIVIGALHGRSRDIIQLGLLVLIATPVARVILAGYAFMRQRDRLYVVVSAIVLTILTLSLMGITP